MNRTMPSLHGGYVEITRTTPLMNVYCRLHVRCKIFYDAFNNLTNRELDLLRFSIISSSFYSHMDSGNFQYKGIVQQFRKKHNITSFSFK